MNKYSQTIRYYIISGLMCRALLNSTLFGVFVGSISSQQHASVSQGRICSDNFACCHTEIEAADQTFYLTQSQYTDTGPTSPSANPITPGTWQGSHWSAHFQVTPPASKAADMAHLCVHQNQALGVYRGFVPDIRVQVCSTHGREDLVSATITSNAEEEEKEVTSINRP